MAELTLKRDELRDHVGEQLGASSWHEVTQEQVGLFADATGDHQWIHVDPERAAAGPFGGTVAHGFLTLSLAPHAGDRGARGHRRVGHDQLRPEQGALPRAAAGGQPGPGRRSRCVAVDDVPGGLQATSP